ncbi:MAG TPA: sigma-54 dependent transcriptional regulator [Vicinamibacterales bacterium]|nr:sigma-54 dependent transcriptional regulator [Vicinamibacterales bacterium]
MLLRRAKRGTTPSARPVLESFRAASRNRSGSVSQSGTIFRRKSPGSRNLPLSLRVSSCHPTGMAVGRQDASSHLCREPRGESGVVQGERAEGPVLIGDAAPMAQLHREIAVAARSNPKVLIVGETGTGKEVVARRIHALGPQRTGPFVSLNCSGLPETLLESELFGHVRGSFTGAYRDKRGIIRQAEGGTLFLDELGEMSLRMQALLLRFVETGEIQQVGAERPAGRANVRLITATHRDLNQQIREGAFRQDLYYRLNVVQIHVPSLRARSSDVPQLMDHWLSRAAETHGTVKPEISAEAMRVLVAYSWPGNVRELRNMAERLALHREPRAVAIDDLPVEITRAASEHAVGLPAQIASAAPAPRVTPVARAANRLQSAAVERLWQRMESGVDFWTAVAEPFRAHEITRADLAALIDRGLRTTVGSYRALLRVFNLPITDYKRFHAFLYQHECNLRVRPYRTSPRPRAGASVSCLSRNPGTSGWQSVSEGYSTV